MKFIVTRVPQQKIKIAIVDSVNDDRLFLHSIINAKKNIECFYNLSEIIIKQMHGLLYLFYH